jgi:CubicO group peptidase (beta-lactamase class C family)
MNSKCVLTLLLAVFCFGSGQTNSSDEINSDRLERIYDRLQKRVEAGELPGTVVLLAHKGKVVSLDAIGFSDVESRTALKTDSIFRLASETKIITAVALLILYEDGKVGLTDRVSDYLPQFKQLTVYGSSEPAKNPLRIQDLLRHTSGYSYGYTDPQQSDYRKAEIMKPGPVMDWSHDMTLEEWGARLSTVPITEEPGTKFRYGLSSDILGLLIERVSGQRLDQFMKERIFEPLKMNSTGFVLAGEQLSRFTTIYEVQDRKMTALDTPRDTSFRVRPKALSGGGGWDNLGNGGLLSSASDMFQFLQMLLNGGELHGVRVLSRKSVELMMQNHLSGLVSEDSIWPGVGFGFGHAVLYDPARYGEVGSVGTIWWAGSTNVHFWMDPREELIGVLMMQVRPFPYLDIMDFVRNMSFHVLK